MNTGAKLALAAIVVLLAVTAWLLSGGPGAPALRPVANTSPAAAADTTTAEARATGMAAANERRDVTATAAVAPTPSEPVLRGRCVDESGVPLAGIPLALRQYRNPLTGEVDTPKAYEPWLRAHPDSPWQDLQITTAADGRFAFRFVVPPLRFILHLDRDGIDHFVYIGTLHAGRRRELGDITLRTTCVLRGRLVDSDGAAVRDAEVWVQWHREGPATMSSKGSVVDPDTPVRSTRANASLQRQTFTAADGSFEVRLQAGDYDVSVQRRTLVQGERFTAQVGARFVDHEVTVAALGTDESISGVVVDARGQPVAGASVSGSAQSWVKASTDEAGRFTLLRAGANGTTVKLSARKGNSRSGWPVARWGDRDARLVLADAVTCTLELRVTGPDGTPITDYRVRGYGALVDYDWKATDGHHDDGVVRLPGVPKGARFVLVQCDRGDLGDSGFVALPKERSALVHLDIELPGSGERLLRVQHSDGTDASGVAVQLLDARPAMPDLDVEARPLSSIRQPELLRPGYRARLLAADKTDARGELHLSGPSGVPLCVRLPGPGHQPMLVPCQLDADAPLVVTLQQGGCVAGQFGPEAVLREMRKRVVAGSPYLGKPRDRAISKWKGIRLRRSQNDVLEYLPSLHEGGVLPADDGSFRIDGVPPGTWQVILPRWEDSSWPEKPAELPALATVTVRDGADTPLVLDLPDWLLATVDVQVLANGQPYGKQQVTVLYGDRTRLVGKGIQTDADGRFQLRPRQGELHLCTMVHTTRGNSRLDRLWSRDRVYVGAGDLATAVFHLDSGTLHLRILDADGNPAAGVGLYLRGDGGTVHMPSSSDADGRLEAEVEPDEFTVLVLPSRLAREDSRLAVQTRRTQSLTDPMTVNLLTVGKVTVKAGETTTAELRLPPEWSH